MPKEKYSGLCLYEISGQTKRQYIVSYDDHLGQLLHHPKLDMTLFRNKVTIKNLGEVLINSTTLERLVAK